MHNIILGTISFIILLATEYYGKIATELHVDKLDDVQISPDDQYLKLDMIPSWLVILLTKTSRLLAQLLLIAVYNNETYDSKLLYCGPKLQDCWPNYCRLL